MTSDDDPGFEPPQMPHHEDTTPGNDRHDDVGAHTSGTGDEIVVRDGASSRSRLRTGLLVGGAAVVVLVLVAVLLVWGPGSPLGPPGGDESPGQSAAASTIAPTPPALPEQFDTFTLQPDSAPTTSAAAPDDDLAVATATYTQNGQASILLVAAQPVDDMEQFLLSLGASEITPTGSGVCASYDGVPLCGVVRDNTGWAVSPLARQKTTELVRIAGLAADAA